MSLPKPITAAAATLPTPPMNTPQCPAVPQPVSSDFKILCHHIYEYHKGLRSLVLHTMDNAEQPLVEHCLSIRKISYCIYPLGEHRMNVFFGNDDCVEIVRGFHTHSLNDLTDEEDFMLGIMLGYDRAAQCARFLKRRAARRR